MSGNPFRRKAAPSSINLTSPETNVQSSDPPADTSRRASKTKRVRIETPPPLSPDHPETPVEDDATIHRVADESHPGSPPPAIDASGMEKNPFDASFPDVLKMQDPEVLENTRRNSATGSSGILMPSPPTGVPINPFAKTLATMENEVHSLNEEPDRPIKPEKTGAMDVDSFARMLMTGHAQPVSVTPQPADEALRPSTINESLPGISASESDEEEDENHTRPLPANPAKQRTKPPLPTHRHGKSVGQRAPQTVSFAEFESRDAGMSATAMPRQPVSRPPTDYSKPLPVVPSQDPTLNIASPPSSRSASDGAGHSDPNAEATQTKSAKPPPPPSRRGGKPVVRPDGGNGSGQTSAQTALTERDQAAQRGSMANLYGTSSSRSSSQQSHRLSAAPPPPPRRRGSSKSSLDAPTSHQSNLENTRPTLSGLSSLTDSATIASAGGARESTRVLDDLAALQAEVDALRAHQHK